MPEVTRGKYKILNRIAQGGMAAIFLAEDPEDGSRLAIKEILPHIAADEEFVHRFVHEVRVMMKLRHPNILPILNAELGPDKYYIVMPLIDKGNLKDLIVQTKKIPSDFSVFVINEILKALDYAHTRDVIHRDLKPSNIMFDAEGKTYLADFGVARVSDMTQLTQTGEVLGTPGYMSPEQALGVDLTPASDLFSIGVIFYELLTGYNPFQADNPVVTMKQVVESHPPALLDIDPSIPPILEPIILKLMRKKVEERYRDAITVMEDLMRYWEERDIQEIRRKFKQFVVNPKGTHGEFMKREAKQRFQRAGEMWLNPDLRPRALWETYQATRMDPDLEEAQLALQRWSRLLGAGDRIEEDPRVEKLEEKWRLEPENVQVLLQLGKIYRMRKDYINLMKVYQRLEHLNPQDSYTVNQMKTLLERPAGPERQPPTQFKPIQAPSFFRKIPVWVYILVAVVVAFFLIARAIDTGQELSQSSENVQQQVNILNEIASIDTDLGDDYADYEHLIQKEKEGDREGALQGFRDLIEMNPGHPRMGEISYHAGRLGLRLNHLEEAAVNLRSAYDLLPPPRRWEAGLSLADALAQLGMDTQAEEVWNDVVIFGGESFAPRALLDRAEYLIRKNMVRTAKHDLRRILEDFPDTREAGKAEALLENY